MGADYSFEVKNVEICARTFFKHNNYFVGTVVGLQSYVVIHVNINTPDRIKCRTSGQSIEQRWVQVTINPLQGRTGDM